jgi:hypothetical protein
MHFCWRSILAYPDSLLLLRPTIELFVLSHFMKRLVIVLLLAIFSVQGMVAAAGIGILNASQAIAQTEKIHVHEDTSLFAVSVAISSDGDDLNQFSIAEELSDYVIHDLTLPNLRHQLPSMPAAAFIPASIILPRILPPPRS